MSTLPPSAAITAPHLKELLEQLPKELIYKYLAVLFETPRPSHADPCAMKARLIKMGEEMGLEVRTDSAGNVVIARCGSPGYENATPVVLQAHYDMVTSQNSDVNHDFAKDPVSAHLTDKGYITAHGTTLGADDGIGCAAALAILSETDLICPPIEALFTADEETTMGGAEGLSTTILKGDTCINLDSEEEKRICIGCAGGFEMKLDLAVERAAVENLIAVCVTVKGLCGGHTGVNIAEDRPNAIKVLHKALATIPEALLVSSTGGAQVNAIPREASAVVAVPASIGVAGIAALGESVVAEVGAHPAQAASSVQWIVEAAPSPTTKPLTAASTSKVHELVEATRHGVLVFVEGITPPTPDTSVSVSITSLAADSTTFQVHTFPRTSSVGGDAAAKAHMAETAKKFGCVATEAFNAFPWWTPVQTDILEVVKAEFLAEEGSEPEVYAIHAGLECGLIAGAYPKMSFVSIGPQINNAHSPDEELEVRTVMPFYRILKASLAKLAPIQLKA